MPVSIGENAGVIRFAPQKISQNERVPTLGLAGNGYGLGARTCMCWTCGRACQAEKEHHDKDISAAVKATKRPDTRWYEGGDQNASCSPSSSGRSSAIRWRSSSEPT